MLDIEKIYEISKGIDEHLRKLESFEKVLREIKSSLDAIKNSQEQNYLYQLSKVKESVDDLSSQLKKRGLPESNAYEKQLNSIRTTLDNSDWPNAVDPSLICSDDSSRKRRAQSILNLLVGEHLKGKKFLDFGCGTGHTVPEAIASEASLAIGYDIDLSSCAFPDLCTSQFSKVRDQAPFDVVLLHDVLDHLVTSDPIETLIRIRSIMSNHGKLYVRNHPWSSRHGGHLYEQTNKAFLHLVLDEVELTRVGGFTVLPNQRVITPLETYRYWFAQAGFRIRFEMPITDEVEPFFLNPSPISERITAHWNKPESIKNAMEISFVEYTLEPAELNHQIF